MSSRKTQNLPRKLSASDNRFAQLLCEGQTQTSAFLVIRPHAARWQPKSVWEAASKLAAKVQPRLKELQDAVVSPLIADEIERQEFWTTTMRSKDEETKDRLRASELLGKKQRDFVERTEHTGAGGAPLVITLILGDKRPIVEGKVHEEGA